MDDEDLLKIFTPLEIGGQESCKYSKKLDFGSRRNDGKTYFHNYYEIFN
jgi:hypothetical protein